MVKPLIFILIFIFSLPSFAQELFEINTSVRALGMGNSYVSVVNDSDSIFYNPAGLAASGGFHWTIADPRVGLNGEDAIASLKDFQSSGDFATALANLSGKKLWGGAGAKSFFRFPYFAFGAYNSIDASLAIDDPGDPMEVNYINDTGYVIGFGFPILPFMHFGLVGRQINRTGNRTSFSAAEQASLNAETFNAAIANEGTGLALDAGLTFTINTPIKPAFSLVIRNAGGVSFEADTAGATPPPSEDQELILGASLIAELGLLSFTPTVDIKHLDNSDVKLVNKLHAGLEIGLPLIDLRAGFHQRYWTAGLGLGIGPIQVDLASYGVEIGTDTSPQEDRRYVVQATIELGVDLGLGGGGGRSSGGSEVRKKRRSRLKQRR